MDNGKLLTLYVRDRSEAAFGQIITRHRALVYMTCLRETGSPSQAEDAAQVVFLLLSRKSKSLRPGPSLAGWLFRTARFVAKDVRKQEARRLRREEIVQEELTPRPKSPAPEWQRIEPLLNGALSALRPADRELILLRFLEGLSLSETGAALGLSEDAARMRVTRAVEKMRRYLAAHGAAVTGLALAGFLTAEASRPVPAQAAEAITQGTLQAISASPTANVLLLSKGVLQTMKISQLKIAALAATTVLIGASVPLLAHALIPHKLGVQPLTAPSLRQVTTTEVPGTQTASAAPATGTQTIVLQHIVPGDIVKSQHWDQLASLPPGVTKIEVIQTQNALAVTATPAGFAKVQEIVKSLDMEPRQIEINSAFAIASVAEIQAHGLTPVSSPVSSSMSKNRSNPNFVRDMTGDAAARFLQVLTEQKRIVEVPRITTTNKTAAVINLTLPPNLAQSHTIEIEKFSVTPQINSDNTVTVAIDTSFFEGPVGVQYAFTRPVPNGKTLVFVLPSALPDGKGKNILLFVTPTLK